MSTTVNQGWPLLDPGQNQKEVTINDDLISIDALVAAIVAGNNGKLLGVAAAATTALGLGAPLAIAGGNLTLGLPADSAQFLNGVGAWAVPPGSGGTVSSVAMTVPSFLSLSGSPITSSGTFDVTLATQLANLVFAGPTSGGAATPAFRALVAVDLPAVSTSAQGACPALSNVSTQYLNGVGAFATPVFVTSVAMTVPSIFSLSGSPITASGTLAVTLAAQNANLVLAGPSSGGAATPAFRALVAADVPVARASVALTDAATIATDASLGNHFRVTLGGNRTMGAPTNPIDGQKIIYELIQDGTGSRTMTWNAVFVWGVDVTVPTLTTTASKRDFIGFVYNSTAAKWYGLAVAKGY